MAPDPGEGAPVYACRGFQRRDVPGTAKRRSDDLVRTGELLCPRRQRCPVLWEIPVEDDLADRVGGVLSVPR